MRSGVLVLLVAHVLTIVSVSSVASADKAKANTAATTGDDEVNASDLALGQPTPTPPPATATAPTPQASPTATTLAPATTTTTVTSPTLASTAVISNGVATTAVVDIRLLPKQLPYRNEQAMDGYVLEERRRWWMIIAGGALFGVGYVFAIASGKDHGFDHGLGFSPIPIAGPWVALAMHDKDCAEDEECFEDDATDTQLVLSGLLQVAGAVLLPIGIMSTKQVWLRKDLAVSVEPTRIGRSGYGAVLNASF